MISWNFWKLKWFVRWLKSANVKKTHNTTIKLKTVVLRVFWTLALVGHGRFWTTVAPRCKKDAWRYLDTYCCCHSVWLTLLDIYPMKSVILSSSLFLWWQSLCVIECYWTRSRISSFICWSHCGSTKFDKIAIKYFMLWYHWVKYSTWRQCK